MSGRVSRLGAEWGNVQFFPGVQLEGTTKETFPHAAPEEESQEPEGEVAATEATIG